MIDHTPESHSEVIPALPQPDASSNLLFEICAAAQPPKQDPRQNRPRKLRLPSSRHPLHKGAWAESEFQSYALALGFVPFRAWIGYSAIDFVLERNGRLLRVQVKATWERHPYHYMFLTRRNSRRRGKSLPYGRAIDFFVAYVPPIDAWYIIPASAINSRRKAFCVYPFDETRKCNKLGHRRKRRSTFNYEVFREAWHLLREHPGWGN